MKIQVISDLHIDHAPFEFRPVADHLIIAGDISNNYIKSIKLLDKALKLYKNVIVVLGNHDSWTGSIQETELAFTMWSRTNKGAHFLSDEVIELEEKMIYGGTMWTTYDNNSNVVTKLARQTMPELRMIKDEETGKSISTNTIIDMHGTFCKGLENAQMLYDLDMVISHHACSPNSVSEYFRGDPLNPAFFEDMRGTVNQELTWVHGHVHSFHDYYEEGLSDSRVVCNPRGYPGESHLNFTTNFTIEI